MFIFNDECVFCSCVIYQTDEKLKQINDQLSRQKIAERLQKHPRSPWWISNDRIVNFFCRIKCEGKVHSTTILRKYLPREQYFW